MYEYVLDVLVQTYIRVQTGTDLYRPGVPCLLLPPSAVCMCTSTYRAVLGNFIMLGLVRPIRPTADMYSHPSLHSITASLTSGLPASVHQASGHQAFSAAGPIRQALSPTCPSCGLRPALSSPVQPCQALSSESVCPRPQELPGCLRLSRVMPGRDRSAQVSAGQRLSALLIASWPHH